VINYSHEGNDVMEYEFYTNEDIQLLTGKDKVEVEILINELNNKLKSECDKYHLEPQIQEGKILKDYFLKGIGVNI